MKKTTTTTAQNHLINQINLIMSLNDDQLNLYTEDTMFKCVEDLSGAICWNSSTKINDEGTLLTPNAFKKWEENPDTTLSQALKIKVAGGDSITKEHFGGVRSGSKFIFKYHYDEYKKDSSYNLVDNFLSDIDKLSRVVVSTRHENELFATIRKRGPLDYKDIGVDTLVYLHKTDRVRFDDSLITVVDSNLTDYFPKVLLAEEQTETPLTRYMD